MLFALIRRRMGPRCASRGQRAVLPRSGVPASREARSGETDARARRVGGDDAGRRTAGAGVTRRPGAFCALVGLLVAMGSRDGAAQVGATTDIITGTVTGPDSQPLAGAIVIATSLDTRVSHQRATDPRGRYTIVFPDGGGRYELTARLIGMAPVQISVARHGD